MLYHLETYGCQMNKAESAALENQFAERGWSRATDESESDLVLINTCSVRITAENRAWGRIAHHAARKKDRPFALVVTGCMAERLRERMKERVPAIDYVLGNFQKQTFGLVLDAVERGIHAPVLEEAPAFVFAPSHAEPGSFRAFVPIMHGCDNYCAYCIVPYVRGHEVSRAPDAIVGELASLAERGVREVTLLGQNVNSYRYGEGPGAMDFPGLLKLVADAIRGGGIQRLRFVSSHPKDLSERTVDVLASDALFARHVHLCAQHGSNRVLAAMNRRYTREYYLGLVRLMRERIPGVSLSSDILMGFPGETEEDVQDTLRLMEEARFAYAYMYYYNPREGTKAVLMDHQVPTELKKERLARVIQLQRSISKDIMKSLVGTELEVLVEGPSKKKEGELLARTDHDMMVVLPAPDMAIGSFMRVRLESLRGTTFRAREVSPCPGN